MGRKSLKALYLEKLSKEMQASRRRMLFLVSYDFKGSTAALRMRLSRHVKALMDASRELDLLCERRTWSLFLCDEVTMPILKNILEKLGCKPEVFPLALNITVIERHLVEALRKMSEGDIVKARTHVEQALKLLRGEEVSLQPKVK